MVYSFSHMQFKLYCIQLDSCWQHSLTLSVPVVNTTTTIVVVDISNVGVLRIAYLTDTNLFRFRRSIRSHWLSFLSGLLAFDTWHLHTDTGISIWMQHCSQRCRCCYRWMIYYISCCALQLHSTASTSQQHPLVELNTAHICVINRSLPFDDWVLRWVFPYKSPNWWAMHNIVQQIHVNLRAESNGTFFNL